MLLKKDELTQEDKEEILDEISDYKDLFKKILKFCLIGLIKLKRN